MKRILLTALAVCFFWGGTLLADEASLVKVDRPAQTVTVKVTTNGGDVTTQPLDTRRVKIFSAAGQEIQLEDWEKLSHGTRFKVTAEKGRITALRVLSEKD